MHPGKERRDDWSDCLAASDQTRMGRACRAGSAHATAVDWIGRRKLLLIGAAAFGAVSLLAAYASSPVMLIVARAAPGAPGHLSPSRVSLGHADADQEG